MTTPTRMWCPPKFKKLIKQKAIENDVSMNKMMEVMADEGIIDIRIKKKKDGFFPKI